MRILEVHNYHSIRGGSDVMFDTTVASLRAAGHDVTTFVRDNALVQGFGARLGAAGASFYSASSGQKIRQVLKNYKPEIVHVHNVYPLISPSILEVCSADGYPVVMRLADQTLLCPTSHCFRDGSVCTDCLRGREYCCILHNCRDNVLMSVLYAGRTAAARLKGTFHKFVQAFTVPSLFLKSRFEAAGFAGDKLNLVPNMVSISARAAAASRGEYAAFLGRSSPEKGISVILEAAKIAKVPVQLALVGNIANFEAASLPPNVRIVGALSRDDVPAFLVNAKCLIVPSLCEEAFCLVCAEAMAAGVPVIGSNIGALPELIDHGVNGFLFDPGNVSELASRMSELWANPKLTDSFGRCAHRKAELTFSESSYVERLIDVFESVSLRAQGLTNHTRRVPKGVA